MPFFSSKKNKVKIDLTENHRDKRKMGKSVDPSRAITEEEPWAIAQQAGKGLSNMRHKDTYGNEITDPDRSNPTRHRLERPLDTIRAFERAIYPDDRDYLPRRSVRYGSTYDQQNSHRASMAFQYGDQSARQSMYDSGNGYSQRPQYQNRNSTYDSAPPNANRYRGEPSDANSGTHSNGANSGWSGDPNSTNPSSDASAFANYEYQQQQQQYGQSSRSPLGVNDKPLPNTNRLSSNPPPMNYQNGYPQQNSYGQQQQAYNGHSQFGGQDQGQYGQSYGQQPVPSKTLAPTPSTASGKGEKRRSWFRRSKS